MSHLQTPSYHIFEPITPPLTTYYTQQPLHQQQQQSQSTTSRQSYIWPQLFNNLLPINTAFNSFEPEAEFVPLEAQNNPHNNGRTATTTTNTAAEEKPFGRFIYILIITTFKKSILFIFICFIPLSFCPNRSRCYNQRCQWWH